MSLIQRLVAVPLTGGIARGVISHVERPEIARRVVVLAVLAGATFLSQQSPRTVERLLLALAFAAIIALAHRYPQHHVPALIAAAALIPFEIGTGTGSSVNVAMLGVAGAFGLLVVQRWWKREPLLRPSAANRAWIVFVGLAGFSIIAGAALWSPWVNTKGNFVFVQAAQWSVFALSAMAFWLGANRIEDRRQLQRITWLFVALGVLTLAIMLMDQLPRFVLLDGPITRLTITSLAGGMAIYHTGLRRSVRLALAVLTGALVAVPWLKGAGWASGYLPSLMAVITLVAIETWRRIGYRFILFVGAVAAVSTVPVMQRIAEGDSWSLDTRILAWQGLGSLLEGRWLFGLGLATYWHYWRDVIGSFSYLDPATGRLHYTFDPMVNLHNNYADVLAQTGIVGILALAWLLFAMVRATLRRFVREEHGFGRAYAAAATATVSGLAFSGMLADWMLPFVYNIGLHGFRDSFVGWMVVGGAVVLDQRRTGLVADPPEPIVPVEPNASIA